MENSELVAERDHALEGFAAMASMVRRYQARVRHVVNLHRKHRIDLTTCNECGHDWPCDTVLLLTYLSDEEARGSGTKRPRR